MPAFTFVSGLCYKKDNKLFEKFLYPYIIWQTIFLVFPFLMKGSVEGLALQFTTPYHALWYLLAYVFWSLFSNVLIFDKRTGIRVLIISFFVALLVGYDKTVGGYMTLSRTIVYFPFFFLGIYIKKYHFHIFEKDKSLFSKVISITLCVFSVILLFIHRSELSKSWLYNARNYFAVDSNIMIRFTNFILACIFIIFFILVVPNKKISLITYIGRNTMNSYILHVFIVKFLPLGKILSFVPIPIICVPILVFVCVVILSSKPLVKLFSVFMEWPVMGIKNKV